MRNWTILLSALAAMLLSGCVDREMKITSQPEGARVFVSNVEVGRTPVVVPFTWYGDYDIILRADEMGYKTLKTHANLTPPLYEIPPLDLLSAMAPWRYHDRRYLNFKLQKLHFPPNKDLIERARDLEKRNLQPVKNR